MPPAERYAFGDFLLDVGERSLARAGSAVLLKPKSFDLLVALVRRAGHLVRKEELLAEVWPDAIVTEANLSHYVWVLRSTLEEGDGGPLIETVPRAGYRFVAAVQPVPAQAVEGPPPPVPVVAPAVDGLARRSAAPRPYRWAPLVAGAAVLLALAGFGLRRLGTAAEPEWRPGEPRGREARRLYLAGVERLRSMDATVARDLLGRATAAEPEAPLALAALAASHYTLGQDAEAGEAARRAAALAAPLAEEDRLWIDVQVARGDRDWPRAISTLEKLFALAPDRLDLGVELAGVLVRAGRAAEALLVVGRLRQLPPELADDPAVDLCEARAAAALGDLQRCLVAAARAVEKCEARAAATGASGLLLVRSYGMQGSALMQLGEHAQAARVLESMRRAAEKLGAPVEVARAEHGLGMLAERESRLDEAEARFRASLAGFRAGGDPHGEANLLTGLAGILQARGELAAAQREYESALERQRAVKNLGYEGRVLHNLAVTLAERGDLAAAEARFREALAVKRKVGDRISMVYTLADIAKLRVERGELAEVEVLLTEAESLSRESGSRVALALATAARAELAAGRGDLAGARAAHEAALAIRRELGEETATALSQARLARVLLEAGEPGPAGETATTALAVYRRLPCRAEEGGLEALLARALVAAGRLAEGGERLAAARRLLEGSELLRPRLEMALAEADWHAASGELAAAALALAGLRQQAEEVGLVGFAMTARLAQARLALRQGDRPRARDLLRDLSRDAATRGLLAFSRQAERLLAARQPT